MCVEFGNVHIIELSLERDRFWRKEFIKLMAMNLEHDQMYVPTSATSSKCVKWRRRSVYR